MTIGQLIERIQQQPQLITFDEVIDTIDTYFDYQPSAFTNGLGADKVANPAGSNEGSCKIFAFGQLMNLTQQETLACFGSYYRDDVLNHPDNSDHANIRNFMQHGWPGIQFDHPVLNKKSISN